MTSCFNLQISQQSLITFPNFIFQLTLAEKSSSSNETSTRARTSLVRSRYNHQAFHPKLPSLPSLHLRINFIFLDFIRLNTSTPTTIYIRIRYTSHSHMLGVSTPFENPSENSTIVPSRHSYARSAHRV